MNVDQLLPATAWYALFRMSGRPRMVPLAFWTLTKSAGAPDDIQGVYWHSGGNEFRAATTHPSFEEFVYWPPSGPGSRGISQVELNRIASEELHISREDLKGLIDNKIADKLTDIFSDKRLDEWLTKDMV